MDCIRRLFTFLMMTHRTSCGDSDPFINNDRTYPTLPQQLLYFLIFVLRQGLCFSLALSFEYLGKSKERCIYNNLSFFGLLPNHRTIIRLTWFLIYQAQECARIPIYALRQVPPRAAYQDIR